MRDRAEARGVRPGFGSILITGASGGLGGALARHFAGPGIRLALGGRDAARLAAVAARCAEAGAEVSQAALDVTAREPMGDWVRGEDARAPLDLVIACAGISGETGPPGEDPERGRQIYRVNVFGLLNTVEPILPAMRRRRGGQIVLVASVSGFRGMPRGPAYSGSKAAVIAQGLAWREALAGERVGVSVACPGYIATAMTQRHRFRMPFLLQPEQAAAYIAKGAVRNRGLIVFPWPLPVVAWLFRALPGFVTRPLVPGPLRE